MKTKILSNLESKMENMNGSSFRYKILDAARKFKTNWLELSECLYTVKKDKKYKEWDYTTFEAFCTKEIGIKNHTANKLLQSYYFLHRHEPQMLTEITSQKKEPSEIPRYEAIDILRKAKKHKEFKDTNYNKLKEDIFEKSLEPREIGKQYRSMLWAARSVDPEAEKKQRRITTIKRLLSTLKTLKKEITILKIVPDKIINDTNGIITALEQELTHIA